MTRAKVKSPFGWRHADLVPVRAFLLSEQRPGSFVPMKPI